MKNALEQHLVTKSGREPGGSLLLSLPPPFSRQGPLGCSSPCLGYGATSAQSCCSSSCLCWSCPGLWGQAVLPFSPVTGAKATNSCTQSHLQHQGQQEAASFGQCRALPGSRWALCAPTDIHQTRPEIPHFLSALSNYVGLGHHQLLRRYSDNCFHSWTPEMPCNEL